MRQVCVVSPLGQAAQGDFRAVAAVDGAGIRRMFSVRAGGPCLVWRCMTHRNQHRTPAPMMPPTAGDSANHYGVMRPGD